MLYLLRGVRVDRKMGGGWEIHESTGKCGEKLQERSGNWRELRFRRGPGKGASVKRKMEGKLELRWGMWGQTS